MESGNILKIDHLTKRYSNFLLEDVSLSVPAGSIVGLIGANGAGKSTLLKSIPGLVRPDSGSITILGKSSGLTKSQREETGVVFDNGGFPENYTAKKLNRVLNAMYKNWDNGVFLSLLEKLSIPADRAIKRFSKGMKMKLAIAAALSHHPRLLILDEPTSGLDPVIREDILNLLMDFIQSESHAILISSHITADLEKISDHIVFINDGKIIFQKEKDELLYQYGLLKCTQEQFDRLDREDIVRYRKKDYEIQVLVSNRTTVRKKYPDILFTPVTIDEIMMLHIRGNE